MSKEEMAGVGDGGMKLEDNERVVSYRQNPKQSSENNVNINQD